MSPLLIINQLTYLSIPSSPYRILATSTMAATIMTSRAVDLFPNETINRGSSAGRSLFSSVCDLCGDAELLAGTVCIGTARYDRRDLVAE